ncbi:MAG: hypothetical protein Tsb0020_49570 [Haliangiales bacterium]
MALLSAALLGGCQGTSEDLGSSAGNVAGLSAVDNPSLDRRCGLDVVLVLDASSSVRNVDRAPGDDNGAVDLVASAANAFIDGFAGTNTRVAVVSYNADPVTQLGLTDVSAGSRAPGGAHAVAIGDPGGVNGPFNPTTGYSEHARVGSGTNWEAGLLSAQAILADARPGVPQLVVHVTDGRPTRHLDEDGEVTRDGGLAVHVAEAAGAADALKAAGVHIYSVGIGRAGRGSFLEELQAVSGPDVFDQGDSEDVFAPADDDVILALDFDSLEALLGDLASRLCEASLTITKLASSAEAPDTFEPYDGAIFSAAPQVDSGYDWLLPDSTPAAAKFADTDENGRAQFQWDIFSDETWGDGIVTVSETAVAGYVMETTVLCTRVNSGEEFSVEADPTTGSFDVPLAPGDTLACEVRNRARGSEGPTDPPGEPGGPRPDVHGCRITNMATVPPSGGYVRLQVLVVNGSEDDSVMFESINDSRFGDLLNYRENPEILTGYCVSELGPGREYGCDYSVFMDGGEPGQVHEDTTTVVAFNEAGATTSIEFGSSVLVSEGAGVRSLSSWTSDASASEAEGGLASLLPDNLMLGDWDMSRYCRYDWESCINLSREQVMGLLASDSDDPRLGLARELVAAWLNVQLGGNDYVCAESNINAGIAWLLENAPDGDPMASDAPMDAEAFAASGGDALRASLADYNATGGGCATVF